MEIDNIVQVLINPRNTKSTEKYFMDLAQIVSVINKRTFLIRFDDYKQFTIDIDHIVKL